MSRLASPTRAGQAPQPPSGGDRSGTDWRGLALRAVGLVVAYFLAVGVLWLTHVLAIRFGVRWLPLVGLALDIGLLITVGVLAARGGNDWGAIIGPLVALLAVVLFFAAADMIKSGERASFWSMLNLRMVAVQTSTIAVASLGMTVIIIAGGIDLSVGTTLALSATMLALGLDRGWSPGLSIVACLATGCAAGLINGLLTSVLKSNT